MKIKPRVVAAIVMTLLSGCAWTTVPRAFAAELSLSPGEPVPLAAGWWYHYYVEGGVREFLNNPQRDGVAALGGEESCQVLRVQHDQAGTVSRRLGIHRQQGWRIPARCLGEKRRLQRSAVSARRVEGRSILYRNRLGPDATRLQHQRANALQRRRLDEPDVAGGIVEPDVHRRRLHAGSGRLRTLRSRQPTPPRCSRIFRATRTRPTSAFAAIPLRWTTAIRPMTIGISGRTIRIRGARVPRSMAFFSAPKSAACGSTRRSPSPIPRRTMVPAANMPAPRSGIRNSMSRLLIVAQPIRTIPVPTRYRIPSARRAL